MKRFMRIFFTYCLLVPVVVSYADELPQYCSQDCAVGYGEVLGESTFGVKAFSNCNNTCVNPVPFLIDETFTGIKWQCVEYARRWLLINKKVVYGDVDVAADIWQLDYVVTPDKQTQKPFINIFEW